VHDPGIGNLVHNVLKKGGLYGFPSSHASNAFAVLVFTSLLFKNRVYSITIFLWALLISYSRIYAGVHYPLDILGGMTLGVLIGYLFFWFYTVADSRFYAARLPKLSKIRLQPQQAGILLLILIAHIVSLLLTAWILHKYNYL